ncbi:glutamyl-tRNA reductase [Thioalkalivibrio sp. XN8]|uniref:glutamyl-tRNA reductase n=1 Tax=Thioalkalivibrio sp. XN8 TaxID=2712863 RepID=UPI0013EAD1A6|nr:glutamyl-tRNA reductase [Thioalkalivibrio sp. XN8]NGP54168.1 glutamyl-tRNA reductase [Thioalkalivibrio sp. XN8]
MSLKVLGVNHRSAPVEIREKLAFNPDLLPSALQELVQLPQVDEMLIVSTCNRTEFYGRCADKGLAHVRDWLNDYHHLGDRANGCLYQLDNQLAVSHTFTVACGLDSAVLGEPQILGQMKEAYRIATEAGSAGPMLHSLFQQAFSVAKMIRTDTEIGSSAVSVAYAAVNLARQIFADFSPHTALLVGAGETIELVAQHLSGRGIGRIVIANRSIERARKLAQEHKGFAIELAEIPDHLPAADIVICSTASPDPLIDKAMVQAALKARKRKPIFMVDLAVPRDVEPEVAELQDVYLYTVDDLQGVIDENIKAREEAAAHARRLIDVEVLRFAQTLKTRDAAPTIRSVRSRAEEIRTAVNAQAVRMLESGRSPAEVMDFLSKTLTNKLMHLPSVSLRRAGEEGDQELLSAARRLFGLEAED